MRSKHEHQRFGPTCTHPLNRGRVRSIVEAQLSGRKILTRRSSTAWASAGGVEVVCRVGLRSVGIDESRSRAGEGATGRGEERYSVWRLIAPLLAVFLRTEKETGPRQGILKTTRNCSRSDKTEAQKDCRKIPMRRSATGGVSNGWRGGHRDLEPGSMPRIHS